MSRMLRNLVLALLVPLALARPAAAQVEQRYIGRTIADVRMNIGSRPTSEVELRDVLETRVGEPLDLGLVRESIIHLMALSRFENVEVRAEDDPRGVVLVYTLLPIRTVRSIAFHGPLGLDEKLLEGEVNDRYGRTPPLGRAEDIARTLEDLYRDHGYTNARVTPRVNVEGQTGAVLAFDVQPGPRPVVRAIRVEGDKRIPESELLRRLELKPGAPYDPWRNTQRSTAFQNALRSDGFYAASIDVTPRFLDDGGEVNLDVTANRGPKVTVRLAGDPLPGDKIDVLLPIKTEKSVDQDLLEDWSTNIERYLRGEGYVEARATVVPEEHDATLTITFNVRHGARHVIDSIEVTGNQALTRADIVAVSGLAPGQPFVERGLQDAITRIRDRYQLDGYTAAAVQAVRASQGSTPSEIREALALQVTEGPRAVVGSVRFFVDGKQVQPDAMPAVKLETRAGRRFYTPEILTDRDNLQLAYLNDGYGQATVSVPEPPVEMLSADRTRADVRFDVRPGPRMFVDHILIVGNNRTKASTIRNELQLKPGDPIALDKLNASQERLSALGLFRRIRVTELQHGSEARRDLLVIVEESPATTIAYGGGVEGAKRLRRDAAGNAVAAIELAPRGLFEIGRRNLWGRNRSINFNSSVAVRPSSTSVVGTGLREYRALGSYREPRIFKGLVDLMMTGGVEQTVRTSYSFNRRSVYAELAHRMSPRVSLYGRYSIERTHVFNEQVSEQDRLLIDKRFPQVRISRLSSSIVRDTRDDAVDPGKGTLASVQGDLAPRALGSEVGFTKMLAQSFVYRTLPVRRRTVFAAGARLGLAAGFRRTAPNGDSVRDVPISERFFSGNTVRGFVEDRLGTRETLTPEGFPKGGNGLIILNAELRTTIWKDLAGAAFVDAGNVFLRAGRLDLREIRAGLGFGFRYRSPIGPIRVDLGFNPARRTFGNGTREPLSSIYFGIGQAF